MIDGTEPAFPILSDEAEGNDAPGLTKLEYIATHTLAGLVSDDRHNAVVIREHGREEWCLRVANEAASLARALVVELNVHQATMEYSTALDLAAEDAANAQSELPQKDSDPETPC